MRIGTKLGLGLAIAGLALAIAPSRAEALGPWVHVRDLIAGQFTKIGTVTFTRDSANVYARYDVTEPGWTLTSVHVYVGKVPPPKSAPGSFPFVKDGLPNVTTYTAKVPFKATAGCNVYLAAHADSTECLPAAGSTVATTSVTTSVVTPPPTPECDLCLLTQDVPDWVTFTVDHPYFTAPPTSYFTVQIYNYLSSMPATGLYTGWCADTDFGILPYQPYIGYLKVLGCDDVTGLLEHPENVDLINWVINQNFVGKTSTCGGAYTWGDVQMALWTLIEDVVDFGGDDPALGDWSTCRADEIVALAYQNGEGFLPCCGDKVALLLTPQPGTCDCCMFQSVFIEVPLECEPDCHDETAWALGAGDFKWKTGWGGYLCVTW